MECTPKKHKLVKRNSKISAVCLKKKTDTVSAFLTKPASSGRKEIYMLYLINVEGKMELKDINIAFQARYVSGEDGPEKGSYPL